MFSLAGQAQFSMTDYLANAISEEELGYSQAKIEFLKDNKFNSPIIREVEFRARIRDFGEGFEDYRLRFSPLNPFEKRANQEYHSALQDQLKLEYRKNLEEVLLSRYLLMIEHIKLSRQISVLEASEIFYQRALSLTQSTGSSSAIKDFIALDKSHLETILDLSEARSELELIEETIKYTYSYEAPISWDYEEIVAIETIRDWLLSTNPEIANNLELKNEQEKEKLDALDYKIEKNETFSNIGYVQAEYREDPDNSFSQNLGMQVAVSLPIVNRDKPKLQRQKLEMLDNSQDLERDRKELEEYMSTHLKNLSTTFYHYDLVSDKLTNYQGREFNTTSTNNALDLMIELHEFQSELKMHQIDSESEIISLYIELRSLNGELSETPYYNYLSEGLEMFEILE